MTTIYCADDSLIQGEAQYGTGGTYGVFIIIEWNQPWGAKADVDFAATFPPEQRHHWEKILETLPTPRVQMIKKSSGHANNSPHLFVAVPSELEPRLYAFQLQDYAELLKLDFAAMVANSPTYQSHLTPETLILVCTNGKRDVCCARDGVALFNALNMADGTTDEIWQSSHLGGHRFSATMLCLPSGLYYGRVAPSMADDVLKSCHDGVVLNSLYRGRACYSKPEQVAEYLLREQTGVMEVGAFRLLSSENETAFLFELLRDGSRHHLTVEKSLSEWQVLFSTGDAEGQTVPIYNLAHYDRTTPA